MFTRLILHHDRKMADHYIHENYIVKGIQGNRYLVCRKEQPEYEMTLRLVLTTKDARGQKYDDYVDLGCSSTILQIVKSNYRKPQPLNQQETA